jgi:hypothetical protein
MICRNALCPSPNHSVPPPRGPAGSLASAASGPQFIARNTTQVKIAVNAKNEALITYRTGWPAQANPGV